jgi:hypothetical protein
MLPDKGFSPICPGNFLEKESENFLFPAVPENGFGSPCHKRVSRGTVSMTFQY